MGNGPSVPHLRDEAAGTRRERRAAKINNHIHRLLWEWWRAAEDARGVYVELKTGERRLLERTDYLQAKGRPDVKRVLSFSKNGEDLNVFIDWVADAPKKTVDAILALRTRDDMVAYVWKHGLQRMEDKVWHLKAPS